MVDFSAPSFSLGLDLDLVDPDLSTEEERDGDGGGRREGPEGEDSLPPGPSSSGYHHFLADDDDEEEEEKEVADFVLKTLEEDPPPIAPVLKRLRRGPPPSRPPEALRLPPAEPSTPAAPVQLPVSDDGIEELSSQQGCVIRDDYSSRQDHSACSSKLSVHGQRVHTTLCARKLKAPQALPPTNGSVPISLEANNNKNLFPRLTTSPLRRIQLVGSDSDDLYNSGDKQKNVIKVDTCTKENRLALAHSLAKVHKKAKISSGQLQSDNLREDLSPKKNINFATPALDEFCEEYFRAVRPANVDKWSKEQTTITTSTVHVPDVDGAESYYELSCISSSSEQKWNLPDPQPPSHQYFYHRDIRIQQLVRQRLCNFVPHGDANCIQKQQSNAETLDYMNQFGQGKVPFQVSAAHESGLEGNLKCRPKIQKNTKGKRAMDTSGTWVNPRSRSAIPKGAGKTRIHAGDRSSGHWYTGQDGRKVYVTRNGQELSGRIAYRHYRKESGAGFRKSRKKSGTAKRKRKR